uniref:Uncharacterized protein n=1 Tax=Oryza brachyantha TaxID=4533 RepID=J3KVW5_ORYBR
MTIDLHGDNSYLIIWRKATAPVRSRVGGDPGRRKRSKDLFFSPPSPPFLSSSSCTWESRERE